jgi:hypothetical protein
VSTAARLYLARCMHDFMPTLLLLRDEHHQRSLRELGKLLGVPRVGELIPTREQLVEEEQSRWNLLKVRELP